MRCCKAEGTPRPPTTRPSRPAQTDVALSRSAAWRGERFAVCSAPGSRNCCNIAACACLFCRRRSLGTTLEHCFRRRITQPSSPRTAQPAWVVEPANRYALAPRRRVVVVHESHGGEMAARSIPGQTAPWPTSKFATKSVARALALGSRTSRLRRLDVVAVLVVFWHGNASLRKAAATRVQSQGGAV